LQLMVVWSYTYFSFLAYAGTSVLIFLFWHMQVHLFDQMDERTLDAICERLKPALCTEGTFLVREGDPVNEMLFIIRGHLDSYTTNGGRTRFFNSCRIGLGDFCGEELLTWALDPSPSIIFYHHRSARSKPSPKWRLLR